nr:hypothetical protein [Tanacetum cinerariifolium]
MQKNLALITKYFKKIYKPTNNNLRTSLNSRNKNVDTTPRYKNDNHSGQFGNQRTINVVGARENVGSPVVQRSGIQCFNCKEFGHFAKECKKPKMEVPTTDSGTDSEPLEHVQNDAGYNVFSNDLQHSEQSESISNTCLVETDDSNIVPDSPDMCNDDIQNDQNNVESNDERVALANLILDVDEIKISFNDIKVDLQHLASEPQAVKATDDSPAVPEHTTVETPINMSPENKAHFEAEKKAIHLILTGIGDEIYSTVDAWKTTQEMWEAIKRLQQGESLNIQDVKTNLFWEFGKFTSHDRESMESYYTRFYKLMNEMIRNNLTVTTMQVNVQFLQQLQPEWSRFVMIVKQQHKLDEVSYHKLFHILKQYQNEVNELRAERVARNANPLALVATAQASQDPYYQTSRSHKAQAPSSKLSIPTRSHTTTRHKGKEIAMPITTPSETASEDDRDPEQAQRDKDMQKNLALIAKYFKKIYKPTNNNLRTSSDSKNKNVNMSPWFKNDNQSRQFKNQRTVNVARARENVRSPVVQQSGIQCFNYREFGQFAKECKKPKRYDWLADTDEKVDEQELEAHYSYMAKIQENDQNDVESDDKRVALANLIANLKLDVDKNKKIQKQLKKANTTLTQELKECKTILAETSKSLGESISVRDSNMVVLQNKQTEFEKYKAFNDRTVDYDKLERKLNEALGQLAQKDTSLLTKSHYEGLVKQKTKVITNLKLREEHDIEKMLSMEKQLKFLNEIVYKTSQSIQTIHMMAPKVSTYNGRPTFANPRYLKQAQSEIPCLYVFPYDQNTHANRLIPDGEETLALERESRSKLNKDSYVESLEKEIDELESDKAEFSNMYDVILQQWKSVDTKFDKPSVVRQPNAQRIPKPLVLGKLAPFSNSLDRIYYPKIKSVPKANVSEGLSKPVTAQTLPQTAGKAVSNTNVLRPGIYRIDNRSTQKKAPQSPQTVRNTNLRVSTSTGVNHKPIVSRPQLKSNQSRDKILPNNSQVKLKKTQVEVHPRILVFLIK